MAASNFFGAVFSRLGTPTLLTEYLLTLELPPQAVLILIMVVIFLLDWIFLLGWPLEWVPIVLIIVPILLPLVEQAGFNLTWFGILVAVNLQTAWLSPPVALSAYFLKGVVPSWDLKDIYAGMIQFMGYPSDRLGVDHHLSPDRIMAAGKTLWPLSTAPSAPYDIA